MGVLLHYSRGYDLNYDNWDSYKTRSDKIIVTTFSKKEANKIITAYIRSINCLELTPDELILAKNYTNRNLFEIVTI